MIIIINVNIKITKNNYFYIIIRLTVLTDVKYSKIEDMSAKKPHRLDEGGRLISIIIMVNNEGNWMLQIIISYEEKHPKKPK